MQVKISKKQSKLLVMLIAMVVIFTSLISVSVPAYAADGTVNFQTGERIEYGSHFTSRMSVDGSNVAYCTEPGKYAPAEGSQSYSLLSEGSQLRKALYYLQGGYGYEKVLKAKCFSGWSSDNAYVIGHLVVSYIYDNYSMSGDAFMGTSESYRQKTKEVSDVIKTLPAPPKAFKAFIIESGEYQDIVGSWYMEPMGWIELQKIGLNPSLTEANSNYSLAGAKYGVYQGNKIITTLTTDAKGYAKSGKIEEGSYTVKEITSSRGYALDIEAHSVSVITDTTSKVSVNEVPQNNPLELFLGKIDKETNKNLPQGAGSLEGAEFTVKFYAASDDSKALRTWVFRTDTDGNSYFNKDYLVSGDDFYYQNDGKTICLPLGVVKIQETKAPTGYLLNDEIKTVNITASGTAEKVSTYVQPVAAEQIKRGDLEFVKVSDGDMKRLSNIPFKITSLTTGESHKIMTDDNGYASTASSWNKHTANTNRGNTSEDGIWFGTAKPDNSKGALLYDRYLVEEVRCNANKGYSLIKFEIVIYKDSVTVKLGTLTDDKIEISTTATDAEDGDKQITADNQVKIVDKVRYTNLTTGKKYKLVGTVMDKATGKELLINDKPVKAEATFTAKEKNGTADVVFTFDGSSLKDMDAVMFEKLYTVEGDIETEIASHEDINSEGQTVKIEKENPNTPKTGDDSNIMLWIIILVLAAAGATAARVISIKKSKK